MIAFDFRCSKGHAFEGWFEDSNAYNDQQKRGLISCPICDDKTIEKIPSTFAIKGTSSAKKHPVDEHQLMMQLAKEVSDYVEKNFDNVGCEFAKEALKIHYGASEPRNIRGISTKKEEILLKKEGIQFFKIPTLKRPDPEPESESG